MLVSLRQKWSHGCIEWILIPLTLLSFSFILIQFSDKSLEEVFIVWSVGQGQMATYVTPDYCYHFDMGGEFFPEGKLFDVCHLKKNQVVFSHWDYDHINFVKKTYRVLPSLCRIHNDLPAHSKKRALVQSIPLCKNPQTSAFEEIPLPPQARPKTSNEASRIFVLKDKVLIPGDSNQRMERYWSALLTQPIQLLVLGHHGSKSSTSNRLLNRLPLLHTAIASARKKRYSHPHSSVVERIRKRRILLIRTEDFNHIAVSLKEKRIHAVPL